MYFFAFWKFPSKYFDGNFRGVMKSEREEEEEREEEREEREEREREKSGAERR